MTKLFDYGFSVSKIICRPCVTWRACRRSQSEQLTVSCSKLSTGPLTLSVEMSRLFASSVHVLFLLTDTDRLSSLLATKSVGLVCVILKPLFGRDSNFHCASAMLLS